ncbi:hypothetical protein IACHDJAJ_00024 [Aeromonas phage vB_AdhS_TS3]|nr:hypothetical protein IACHDJAJ_00024 [Aeromonas phage vB_AdhS_TS3]
MATYLLVLYLSTGFGQYATGGPVVVDNITSEAACEKIANSIKNRIGRKYDWHICERVEK